MVKQLPTVKGWTMDAKLKQFRKVDPQKGIVFVDFKSAEGDSLLGEAISKLDMKKKEDKDLLSDIWS
jgi:hypothetical protein